jgi:hypothetical protein
LKIHRVWGREREVERKENQHMMHWMHTRCIREFSRCVFRVLCLRSRRWRILGALQSSPRQIFTNFHSKINRKSAKTTTKREIFLLKINGGRERSEENFERMENRNRHRLHHKSQLRGKLCDLAAIFACDRL